jgi:hypothetical protein
MTLELRKYYDVTYTKNHDRSNQLRLAKPSVLNTLLLKELEKPRAVFGSKLPFWIHGEDVWLEVQQSTNLPSRVDATKVIFLLDEEAKKLTCHFKKMEPFNLSHYIPLQTISIIDALLDEQECKKNADLEKRIIKRNRANLNAVCFWKNHPSCVGEKKIEELLWFYDSFKEKEKK